MDSTLDRGARNRGTMLLADISGYTGFLRGVETAHAALFDDTSEPPGAYAYVSRLLDGIVGSIVPPFRLIKFEGDAVFVVADTADPQIHGPALPKRLRATLAGFDAGLATARAESTCACGSCARIQELGLKFVIHHGQYITQRIAGHEELAGPDVILAHRLLKNHAREVIGAGPYALITDAALALLETPADAMVATTEAYDDLAAIPVHILPLN
jgi:Protein of unknown function (DUF2652)